MATGRKREQPAGWVSGRVDVSGWVQRGDDVVEDAADGVGYQGDAVEELARVVRRGAAPAWLSRRAPGLLADGWVRLWAWETVEGYRAGEAPVAVALCVAHVDMVWGVSGVVPTLTCVRWGGVRWYVAMARDDVLAVLGFLA
jgi:hypothetical protein